MKLLKPLIASLFALPLAFAACTDDFEDAEYEYVALPYELKVDGYSLSNTDYTTLASADFRAAAYRVQVEASDSVQWTFDIPAAGRSWITCSEPSGRGSKIVEFRLSTNVPPNSYRSTTLTLRTTNPVDVVMTKNFSVSQKPSRFYATPTAYTFYANEDYSNLTLDTNLKWRIETSGDAGFIKLSETAGEGDAVVEVQVSENTTGKARAALINIICDEDGSANGTLLRSINVLQQAE